MLKVINQPADIDALIRYLEDKDLVAVDTETTGVTVGSEVIGLSFCAEETKAFYIVNAFYDLETKALAYIPGMKPRLAELIQVLNNKRLLMHNSVFDCARIHENFKISLIGSVFADTMIMAHLANENQRVGLKELGKSIFGESADHEAKLMKESVAKNGGLLTKKNYEMWKADWRLMGEYGAKDALLTFKLFHHFLPILAEQGLDDFFFQDESMPMLRTATYELNTQGLKVDQPGLISLKKQLEAECAEAKAFIHQEINQYVKTKYPGTNKKNGFNIGSSQQLSWLLFGVLKLDYGNLTKAGKQVAKALGVKTYSLRDKRHFLDICIQNEGMFYEPPGIVNGKETKGKKIKLPWAYVACDKKTLKTLAPRYKWIERLLEYQRKTKLLSTYITGLQERIQYGVIYPSFLQHGTTSGRYSSRNPNFQNLPRDDKRIKSCIVSRPGRVFVGADYSQLEPRVFAFFSGDDRLKTAFAGTDDFYSTIGMEVYGKYDCEPTKESFGVKYKNLRDLSKVIALASTYGATSYQLAPTTGKSIDDTQKDIDAYFNKFPGVARMMVESHETAKRDGQVVNLFGRPRRIPEAKKINQIYGNLPHRDLPYEARGWLNLAVNHRIQSTGASIVNRAAIAFGRLCQEAGVVAKLVCQVHDSLIAECAEADGEVVAMILQHAMEKTTELPGVRLEAVPKIGYNLGEV